MPPPCGRTDCCPYVFHPQTSAQHLPPRKWNLVSLSSSHCWHSESFLLHNSVKWLWRDGAVTRCWLIVGARELTGVVADTMRRTRAALSLRCEGCEEKWGHDHTPTFCWCSIGCWPSQLLVWYQTHTVLQIWCELWHLRNRKLLDVGRMWNKSIRRIWNLPYNAHCSMLPLLCQCLPVFEEFCCRFIKFVQKCVTHCWRSYRCG